jgi:hypothetical protein
MTGGGFLSRRPCLGNLVALVLGFGLPRTGMRSCIASGGSITYKYLTFRHPVLAASGV